MSPSRSRLLLATGVALVAGLQAPAQSRRGRTSRFSRDHARVREAFREVVSQARSWTVRIRSDGRPRGLGAIVHADGLVVAKASEIRGTPVCEFADGRKLEARVVGVDEPSDLALLAVGARGLPVIRWASGQPPPPGAWVVSPGTGELPLSIGVVSTKVHRRSTRRRSVLPVSFARSTTDGAKVAVVHPGTAAARAGLKAGDVITRVGDREILSSEDFERAVRRVATGTQVKVVVRRSGQTVSLTGTVRSGPDRRGRHRQERFWGPLSQVRAGFPSVLQHDSVLLPVDCGGPLLNLDGQAVGINISRRGRVETLALPAASVRKVIGRLMKLRKTERAKH